MSAGWRLPAGGGRAGEGVLQLGEPPCHCLHPSVQPERATGFLPLRLPGACLESTFAAQKGPCSQ